MRLAAVPRREERGIDSRLRYCVGTSNVQQETSTFSSLKRKDNLTWEEAAVTAFLEQELCLLPHDY